MSVLIVLVCGMRLPEEELSRGGFVLPEALRFGKYEGQVVEQTFAQGSLTESPAHLAWLARFFGLPESPVPTACFELAASGAPRLAGEIWRLVPYRLDAGRCLPLSDPLTEMQNRELSDLLLAAAASCGARLQRLGQEWFLASREPLGPAPLPWENQLGRPPANRPENPWGAFCAEASRGLDGHPVNAERLRDGLAPVAGFFPDGGGAFPRVKPTAVRVIFTDSLFVRGLGLAATVPASRIVDVDAGLWPEAPEGDALCVMQAPYADYATRDYAALRVKLAPVLSRVEGLVEEAARHKIGEVLVAFAGAATVRSARFKLKNAFGIVTRPKADTWDMGKLLREEA